MITLEHGILFILAYLAYLIAGVIYIWYKVGNSYNKEFSYNGIPLMGVIIIAIILPFPLLLFADWIFQKMRNK